MESSSSYSSRGAASFFTQANALLRKNLTFQKRNLKTNIGIVAFPILLCAVIVLIQKVVEEEMNKYGHRCGCQGGVCGIQYSSLDQFDACPISSPFEWPALLQVPRPESRAVTSDHPTPAGLPDESCKVSQSCPASVLFTGGNQSFAQILAQSLFLSSSTALNLSDFPRSLSTVILGTDTSTGNTQFMEPAFVSDRPLYLIQPQCASNATSPLSFIIANKSIELGKIFSCREHDYLVFFLPLFLFFVNLSFPFELLLKKLLYSESLVFEMTTELQCVQGLTLWRDNSSLINDELFNGYQQGNSEKKIKEFIAAYDFLNSDEKSFNLNIGYNSTYNNDGNGYLVRVPRSVNLASNAYLKFHNGPDVMAVLEYLKEMPKTGTQLRFDISSLLGALFFTWIIELLFPVILTYLVYERQQKLKIMMKMHGLTDGPYWLISYVYFFSLSSLYMICFVIFGSLIGLKFFRLNDYSVQIVFYFFYINLQIAMAFLASTFFSAVKTATVTGYIYVFGSGLLGPYLLQFFIEDTSFPRAWIIVMELIPGFSLYRGLYELSQYSFKGDQMGTSGMQWRDLNDRQNGMKDVLIIMFIEWLVFLPVAYYLDQVLGGIRKDPLFWLNCFQKKSPSSQRKPSLQRQGSEVLVETESTDVSQEREVVEHLLLEPNISHAVISDNLKKVYPGCDGNPDKHAVRGLSLALPNGECFGMLGPNGAGKTTFINMMIGLITPSSGTAYVQGMDIRTNMDQIYTSMGVCPQHDLLWETLTGREHLLFYGRLKNLKGRALLQAVEESLKSVDLFYGGVGDKQVAKYSGGMRRRLSVAISLIGDPKVVYMDEPSTGLDPASRNRLWNVVKHAKRDRAIILTTHSMEEAEVLCDRLGIFVDGGFQCIGNAKELKARYGGSYVFTMTTSANEEEEVENLVRRLSPNANKIYHISGTQKFELPKQEVRISDVFRAVEIAKSKLTIHAWGLADATLEDVFIKVANNISMSFHD
ncbi:hypothetical protein C4D60_Mb03t21380 [Musa balbisiana]|uniref:ABC transporter domain-containing protein n=1 Tax=Musa balbisiana TaxID=52838 RepID=A0A4S8JBV4_MUSBA|nr:hypothetical protein C4D60_Mb03t21380 [Musa balbisiana]